MNYKYRLITRSDFDGLVCAMLLKEMKMLDDIKFVHPKDVQEGLVDITDRDILTNLPFDPNCHLCFDHHASEEIRNDTKNTKLILEATADSAARVVYNYYGGAETFPGINLEMMEAVDRADSARFERQHVLAPQGWEMLNFIMDPRTGLGRFRNYRVSNYNLMMALIDLLRHSSIDEVLAMPDVRERVEVYNAQREMFCEQIGRCASVDGDVVVNDIRGEEIIFAGNRFMIYALYPESNVSVQVMPGRQNMNTVIAVGKSIFKRNNPANVGEICLRYGGGGHHAAGTCQVAHEDAERVIREICDALNCRETVDA